MKKENRRKKLSFANNDGRKKKKKKKRERTMSSRAHSVSKDSACSQFTSVDKIDRVYLKTMSKFM